MRPRFSVATSAALSAATCGVLTRFVSSRPTVLGHAQNIKLEACEVKGLRLEHSEDSGEGAVAKALPGCEAGHHRECVRVYECARKRPGFFVCSAQQRVG